jgi:O-methyltransferase domain/Dimerisation domain
MTPSDAKAPLPAPSQLIQMIWGFMASQALHVAAKLGVFDELRDGPKTVREVAEASDSQELPLRRLLRFLTAIDLVTEDEKGRFSSTALGALLRSDHPQSVRPMAVMYGEPFYWRPWGDLYATVKTGMPAFERVFGEPFFEYLALSPEEGAIFDAGMTGFSNIDVPAILEVYDFSGLGTIVDVAGGHGALLRTILERYPYSRGVLCDMPSVIAGATELKSSDVATRCELITADFFKSVPAGGDAYILKRILHDWNDEESVHILKNCRRAIAAGGKLLVIEQVVKPSNQPDPAKWMDLNMLTLLTGRERTESEFRELYARAGFKLTRVVPAMRLSIVEGVAA